jgi:Domain of unknown function (DUF397)
MDSYDPAAIADALPRGAWKAAASCGPNGGNCVEVNLGARGLAGLRDSKSAAGPVLVFDVEKWRAFLDTAESGRFYRT